MSEGGYGGAERDGGGFRRMAGGRRWVVPGITIVVVRSLLSPRILLTALVVSAALDYMEWVEHHPPVMAIIIVLHFVFVWVVLAIVAFLWRRFG